MRPLTDALIPESVCNLAYTLVCAPAHTRVYTPVRAHVRTDALIAEAALAVDAPLQRLSMHMSIYAKVGTHVY